MRRVICTICWLWALVAGILSSFSVVAQTVHICRNGSEYPPYVYWERIDGEINKTRLTGATTDFLKEIFKEAGLEYTETLIPWSRCIREVERFGKNGKYEVFTDGSFSETRAQKYLITAPIYRLSEGMWYSAN